MSRQKQATNNKRGGAMAKSFRQKERQAYMMIAPQLIGFLVFSIYPILWVFRYAFYDYDGITATFIGLENFVRVFTRDLSYWQSVLNTMIIAYGKLIIEIPLAFVTAIILSSNMIKVKKIFSVVYYLPTVMGVAVSCMIFSFLFATMNGMVNNGLMAIGLIDAPIAWFSEKWSALAVIMLRSIWAGFAANLLYFMAGVQNISEDVLEAARDEDVEVVLVGEVCEWDVAEYIRDTAALGGKKAMLVMGHMGSERDGMRYLEEILKDELEEVETRYFDCGEVYTYTK